MVWGLTTVTFLSGPCVQSPKGLWLHGVGEGEPEEPGWSQARTLDRGEKLALGAVVGQDWWSEASGQSHPRRLCEK